MANFPLSKVPSKHTKPELEVRSFIHRNGFRFTLHTKHLAGSPDIVLPSKKKIIFVNGCFWHGHKTCNSWKIPKTNKRFWKNKIETNKNRDTRVRRKLKKDGWEVYTVWTCQLRKNKNGFKKLLVWLQNE